LPPRRSVLDLDYSSTEREILSFIRKVVREARANGAVVGLSGGVDSAVVGALCLKALGKDRVTVLLMPSDFTPASDLEDASALAKKWGVRSLKANISRVAEHAYSAFEFEGARIPKANVLARIRMVLCYYLANSYGPLVAGTGDKSEGELGFFTKLGDGGVDFLPIAHLYKTQVRMLGARLGVPEEIVNKPASPQLWPGHRASDELPADYDVLDPLLHYLFDAKLSPAAAAKRAGVAPGVVREVLRMHRSTAHKRALPPMLRPW
jgi:NAD+ synthase